MWINLCTSLFADPANRADDEASLRDLLDLVVKFNVRFFTNMRRRGHVPLSVYAARLRYIPEAQGIEDWCDAGQVLHRGGGDCEDLACYQVGWLKFTGEDPRAKAKIVSQEQTCPSRTRPPCRQYHILVERGNGKIEDPSAVLGMHRALAMNASPLPSTPRVPFAPVGYGGGYA